MLYLLVDSPKPAVALTGCDLFLAPGCSTLFAYSSAARRAVRSDVQFLQDFFVRADHSGRSWRGRGEPISIDPEQLRFLLTVFQLPLRAGAVLDRTAHGALEAQGAFVQDEQNLQAMCTAIASPFSSALVTDAITDSIA